MISQVWHDIIHDLMVKSTRLNRSSYETHIHRRPNLETTSSNIPRLLVNVLLTLSLLIALIFINLFRLTSFESASQVLVPVAGHILEIDRFVAVVIDDPRSDTRAERPQLPLDLNVSPAPNSSPTELSAYLLEQAAQKLYYEGLVPNQELVGADSQGAKVSTSNLSPLRLVSRFTEIFSQSTHNTLGIFSAGAALLTFALFIPFLFLNPGFRKMISLGICTIMATLPVLLVLLLSRIAATRLAGSYSDPFLQNMLEIAALPVQVMEWNYFILLLLGLGLTILGILANLAVKNLVKISACLS